MVSSILAKTNKNHYPNHFPRKRDAQARVFLEELRTKEAHALMTSSFRPQKIGDIKKTVAAFSLQHGVYTQLKPPSLNTLKSCKTKTNPKFGGALFSRTSEFSTHQNNLILAFHQFEAHWLSKTISVIPRLFKEDFVLTFFESEAKHRFCHRGCRSVWNQTARIWPLCLLSLGRSARSRHNAWGSLLRTP